MRNGFLGSLAALVASGGLAFGQSPYPVNGVPVYGMPVYMPPAPVVPSAANLAPSSNILQGMPQGYDLPYAPGAIGVATVQQSVPPQPSAPPNAAPPYVAAPYTLPPTAMPMVPQVMVPRVASNPPPFNPAPAFNPMPSSLDKGPVVHGWPASSALMTYLRAKSAGATGLPPVPQTESKSTVVTAKGGAATNLPGSVVRTGGKQDNAPNVLPDTTPNSVPLQNSIPLPNTGAVPGPEWTQTPPPMVDPAPGTPLLCEAPAPQKEVCDTSCEHPLPNRDYRGYCGYLQSDALFWSIQRAESPILLTSTSVTGASRSFSASDIGDNEFRGNRTTLGFWLNSETPIAFEGTYFFLGQRNQSVTDKDPTIFRPFTPVAGDPTGTTAPRQISGIDANNVNLGPATAILRTFTRLWGVEANVRYELMRGCFGHVDLLSGFRFIDLDENLSVETDQVAFLVSPLTTKDDFGTQNHFAGGQIGLEAQTTYRKFSLDGWIKGAIGNNQESVNINGSTAGAPAVGPAVVSGGFLALPTNSGHFTRNVFTVVPEAGMTIGYCVSEKFRLNAGYSFLYLNDVVRPGNQVDTTINFSQQNTPGRPTPPMLVGEARPAFEFHESSFWAQGVTAGIEFRW